MLRPRFLALLCGLLCGLSATLVVGGCDGALGDVPLGGDEADDFVLAQVPALTHIAAAIDGGENLTLRTLIDTGDSVVFARAPNPTQLLTSTNVLDDARSRDGRQPLSILTYNVALLDVDIFGFIPYAQSPDLTQRRRVLPGLIFETGADIILLQEVWQDEDVEAFSRRALTSGYTPFTHDRSRANDGLVVFIRSAVIAGGTTTEVDFQAYASQVGSEYFPGPGIARGFMSVRFVHAAIGEVQVFNTHMQAFPENWLGRVKQARELGIAMRAASESTGAFVVVGGDFNSGPYYKYNSWQSPDTTIVDRGFHNALSYAMLLTYGDLVDAAIMGRPAVDALADITLGDTVRNEAGRALEFPGAQDGWCATTPAVTFTATDCNSLYFQQYGGTEAPARLDHIFVSDKDARVVVDRSQLVFTEKQAFAGLTIEPSDHFGVRVDLLVTPK